MKKRVLLSFCTTFCFLAILTAQDTRIYPVHWWTGMKYNKVQLMMYNPTGLPKAVSASYPGVKILKQTQPENSHYLFVDIEIGAATRPGTVNFKTADGKTIPYVLKSRVKGNGVSRVKGVGSEDLVYLIMPDRFVNGDPSNDQFADLEDKTADRSNPFARHGGDMQGVQSKLDYLKDLGVTTVWMTPVNENDMPRMVEGGRWSMSGYHGYWITSHYEMDKRHGGNEAYRKLADAAHAKGMKIVQDAVYNHVGERHHTVLDMPMKAWLNQWPAYTGSNHREEVFYDPYASALDKKVMVGGWFVPHLPDLNLSNPMVAKFVIQYSIWATEEFGIDGWRVDTYKYCDEKFLNDINTALEKEFPSITVFGEAWTQNATGGAYFAQNNITAPFRHNLQGITDFPLNGAILDAVNQPFGWNEGVNRLYTTLSQDVLYKNPLRNCIFLDNHDMNRAFSVVGENLAKYKMALGLMLTLRGIPQLYYGNEIGMKNFKNPTDAEVRHDFPGGWPGDTVNKFTSTGRSALENEIFDYVRTLAKYRQGSPALTKGKTMQFIPQNGVYVFFRYTDRQTVMCVLNSNDQESSLGLSRYQERTNGFSRARNVITGTEATLGESMAVPAKSFTILELR
ncbi:MAG: alpha-amylase family glycosyl hydrolase [Chitinophagaceae bacterium]|nr:alpha-amylase family glycosyl hydrolase [Chitinophagaceae bacterium]